jgi:hypothetical protein
MVLPILQSSLWEVSNDEETGLPGVADEDCHAGQQEGEHEQKLLRRSPVPGMEFIVHIYLKGIVSPD